MPVWVSRSDLKGLSKALTRGAGASRNRLPATPTRILGLPLTRSSAGTGRLRAKKRPAQQKTIAKRRSDRPALIVLLLCSGRAWRFVGQPFLADCVVKNQRVRTV